MTIIICFSFFSINLPNYLKSELAHYLKAVVNTKKYLF